jgi:acetylornithine deacetylase/succinyl-diaminopimelate desuccinylase-like protein
VSDELDALIHETADWLRIPSISAGRRNEAGLRAAAEWALRRVRDAGGDCDLADTPSGAPLVVGELRASGGDGAPTVLIYGHYDVQDPGDESAWTTPPFEPDIRDGRLYARGACDDKGNFLPLLHVACAMADSGELPVNVRVLVEGAEEVGSEDVNAWVREDSRGADVAVVFDSAMPDERTPALTLATRGIVMAHVEVRTGTRLVHSGMYGGAAMNAAHALHAALGALLPRDGLAPEELRAGVQPPAPEELESWNALPPGDEVLAEVGARPADERAAAELYTRTTADASVDVNWVEAGEPRTVVPCVARAAVSVRLAPGQDPAEIAGALEALVRGALPDGAELTLSVDRASPWRVDPQEPAIALARRAYARALGREPALMRIGGSLPILDAFAARGIPAIVSGFALPQDGIHAPDESFSLASLDMGRRAARALYEELAGLGAG